MEDFDPEEEPVAYALMYVGRGLRLLGNADACTAMGGLEALGAVHKAAMIWMSASIDDLARAQREQAEAIQELARAVASLKRED